jgi:transposase
MFVAKVPNRNSPPTFLLRESYREEGSVKSRTLSNLTHLPQHIIELIRRSLNGESFVSSDETFEKVESWHHGHVDAVIRTIKKLGLDQLIGSRRSRSRDLILAMIVGRILEPDRKNNSKLANPRWWDTTTLPQLLDLGEVNEDELYEAMDWLLERQPRIEKKLAHRHLEEGSLVFYDLTSSYFEGVTCPLAAFGHNRDGKKGKLQVNYGLLADQRGRPIAVSVFPGNTSDSKTVIPQIKKIRDRFGIEEMVMVGDRGMVTQKLIDEELRDLKGVDWITALRSGAIKKLIEGDKIQLGLFDERNLFEVMIPEFPGERLVACRNTALAKLRDHKRCSLLEATNHLLTEAQLKIQRAKLRGEDKITQCVEKVLKRYNLSGHFELSIRDDSFRFQIKDNQKSTKVVMEFVSKKLKDIANLVDKGDLKGKANINKRLNLILAKYNISEHVSFDAGENLLDIKIQDNQAVGQAALKSICEELEAISLLVKQGRFGGKDKIGLRIGKIINKYKVEKHFRLEVRDDGFDFHIEKSSVEKEKALDGIYIVRTSTSSESLSPEDTVRTYKNLCQIERAFGSIKTLDIHVRPIRHRLENRVKAHIFLCTLAYYVVWHMKEAWRPLLFADEDQEAKKTRDPVAPAERSEAALRKVHSKTLEDDSETHSFHTIIKLLSQIVRNNCRPFKSKPDAPTFTIVTTPNEKQQRAYDLIDQIKV